MEIIGYKNTHDITLDYCGKASLFYHMTYLFIQDVSCGLSVLPPISSRLARAAKILKLARAYKVKVGVLHPIQQKGYIAAGSQYCHFWE